MQSLQQQQRLIALQNDFAKLKIDLARLIGAQPTDQFSLTEDLPFVPAPALDATTALQQAREQRADLKASVTAVHAAELDLSASKSAYLPTVNVNADYGTIGPNPNEHAGRLPWSARSECPVAGRPHRGADRPGRGSPRAPAGGARRSQSRRRRRDPQGDVRRGSVRGTGGGQRAEPSVSRETLELTRQRFEAGVSGNIEVVQAQDSVSVAAFDYINSVFSHNVAKLNLARSLGNTEVRIREYLRR